jgi:hypothetical protein
MFKSKLPFNGTYETEWDPRENYPTNSLGGDLDNGTIDFGQYLNALGKIYTAAIEAKVREWHHFGNAKIQFAGVWSPREYNFANDEIDVLIDANTINLLRSIAHDPANADQWGKWLTDRHASRDGFVSYYSDDPEHWMEMDLDELQDCHIETYLWFALNVSEPEWMDDVNDDCSIQVSEWVANNYQYEYPKLLDLADDLCPDWNDPIWGTDYHRKATDEKLVVRMMVKNAEDWRELTDGYPLSRQCDPIDLYQKLAEIASDEGAEIGAEFIVNIHDGLTDRIVRSTTTKGVANNG